MQIHMCKETRAWQAQKCIFHMHAYTHTLFMHAHPLYSCVHTSIPAAVFPNSIALCDAECSFFALLALPQSYSPSSLAIPGNKFINKT